MGVITGTPWTALGVGLVTGGATLVGGGLALRFRSAITLFLGFSSGAVIGVALFDLLPEALKTGEAAYDPLGITSAVALGFLLYLTLDRLPALVGRGRWKRVPLGPGSLVVHSLMDGLGIGIAFKASPAIGWVVAIAVLAHDFLDGANTVALSLASDAGEKRTRRWLIADAAAPLLGIALAQLVSVSSALLALLLGLFSGLFLYIGASELLPRSQLDGPRLSTLAATVLGMAFIYSVIRLAGS